MMGNKLFGINLFRKGLVLGAISLEVDDVASLPEFQRGWYDQDTTTKKFKLNPARVDIEDVSGLKNTVAATREEARLAKAATKKAIEDALAPFAGIDPVKTRELMSQFEDADEAKLLSQGKAGIDQIISKRTEKLRAEYEKKLEEAMEGQDGALEVASTYMEAMLDNRVNGAITGKVHDSVLKNGDALRMAREIFSLNDDGEAVQFIEGSETDVVMGKDGKTPFTPQEWIESMRTVAPHWFPAGGSGGGAGGGDKGGVVGDVNNMSPTQKMNAGRQTAKK